jgi:hypothetical protein
MITIFVKNGNFHESQCQKSYNLHIFLKYHWPEHLDVRLVEQAGERVGAEGDEVLPEAGTGRKFGPVREIGNDSVDGPVRGGL